MWIQRTSIMRVPAESHDVCKKDNLKGKAGVIESESLVSISKFLLWF